MKIKDLNHDIIIKALEMSISEMDIQLNSIHKRLSIPIINRIYKKMMNEIKFDAIKVCENLIIDGHHRYVSSIIAKSTLATIKSHKTSATKKHEWLKVEFTEEEWDTDYKIEMLNKRDAEFNNIPLEDIIEITR